MQIRLIGLCNQQFYLKHKMQPELKLIIYENEKVIHTVQKETFGNAHDLITSLEEFRQAVNDKLTEIIEDDGRIDDYIKDEISSSDDEKETIQQYISPKKRKT